MLEFLGILAIISVITLIVVEIADFVKNKDDE